MHFKNTPITISEAIYSLLYDEYISYTYIAHTTCTLLFLMREFAIRERAEFSQRVCAERQSSAISAMTHLNASDWPVHS